MKKLPISTSEVNKYYILTLVETSSYELEVQQFPVASTDEVFEHIDEMVENTSYNVRDLINVTDRQISNSIFDSKTFNLCYPFEYTGSFVEEAKYPESIGYDSYRRLVSEYINQVKHSYRYYHLDIEKKQEYLNDKLADFEHKLKQSYAEHAKRYIGCIELDRAYHNIKKRIKEQGDIKMYSSDSIGWTTLDYTIDENIQVQIKTNFCYGRSAYLNLTIKYKDIILIPYSYLVHYYYANTKNLISCTRAYRHKHDSWFNALEFVCSFANNAKKNPEKFITEFILTEINAMMTGLKEIMLNPGEVLSGVLENELDYISFRVIRPYYDKDDTAVFEMMPSESTSVFKAEKITGALDFINSLREIESFRPEIGQTISEIIELNKVIEPEINDVLRSIDESLKPLEKQQNQNHKKMEGLDKRFSFHLKQIDRLQKKSNSYEENQEIKRKYIDRHPIYNELIEQSRQLQKEINELEVLILRRKSLLERMAKCKRRITGILASD